jgi:DNA-binding XRE family transcriptional regulator
MSKKVQHLKEYQPLLGLLKEMRGEAGLTQRSMAAKLGKSHNFVYYCETGGRRVDPAEFLAWADACDVDPVVAWRRYLKVLGRS